MISYENPILSETMMGVETPIPPFVMDAAVPDGAPPRAASLTGFPDLLLPRRAPRGALRRGAIISVFSWFGGERSFKSIFTEHKM